MNEDYYELLGVSRDASQDQIKKAYRKLARTLHPDVNPDPDAAEKFKLVSQAYETLANEEKRRMYDMGGGPGGMGGGGFGGFSDIFDMFTGGMGQRNAGPVPRTQRGGDLLQRVGVELADVIRGGEKTVRFTSAAVCPRCYGSCGEPDTKPVTCTVCKGQGHVQRVVQSLLGQMATVTVCSACQGHGDIIEHPCVECSGYGRVRDERELRVKIPAGAETGVRLRLRSEGEAGVAGGPAGDLFIEIHVARHPVFVREGDNLQTVLELPMTAAALGATITLETFDGPQEVVVPAGSQPGDEVRLRGLGVTGLSSGRRGDIRVSLKIVVPTKLNERQRELLSELATLRGEEKPESKVPEQGVFSWLRDKFNGR
ncbi:molecular chaperone DnaJ [Dermabacteraceae bacterium TAE3-ERU27]|nr:molecular chaperone DnaJ [Dermabacteraceae bacterium TAE3-ERU27]